MPKWIVYCAIPLGSYLMCFRFLQVAWRFARTGELPHHDHGQVEGIEEVNADRHRPRPRHMSTRSAGGMRRASLMPSIGALTEAGGVPMNDA